MSLKAQDIAIVAGISTLIATGIVWASNRVSAVKKHIGYSITV